MSPLAAIFQKFQSTTRAREESQRRRMRRALSRRRRFFVEPLEPRFLLDATTSLLPAQTVALKDGLKGFADWADTLDTFDKLSQSLALVGQTVGNALDIGGLLKTTLVDPAVQHLNQTDVDPLTPGDQAPSMASLANLLSTLSGFGSVSPFSDSGQVGVGLTLSKVKAASTPIDFGSNTLGFAANSSPTASFTTSLNLNFQFGLDLTSGLSAAESFFIRVTSFTAQGSVASSGLNFGANIGFLGANVSNGTAALNANLSVALKDPNTNGKITLTELQGTTPLSNLASISATSLLDVDLPVSASLGSFNLSGTVHIDDADLFDGNAPSVTQTGLDEGLNFNQITPDSVLGVINSLKNKFDTLSTSSLLNSPIPFTSGQTLGSLLNLGSVFNNKLINLITASPTPNFVSAQDLATKLSSVLKSPVSYDPSSDEMTIDVEFAQSFSPASVPINLNLSLGALGGITTSSTISLTANADLAFKMIIDLTPPTPGNPYLIANNMFVKDAAVTGQVTLSATDIDATAKFGFVGIQITDGTATGTLSAGLTLHNPTQPAQTRMSLTELGSALINDPSSLGSLTRSGSATLSFPNISVLGGVITPLGLPSATFSFPDITNLASFTPTFTNFSELLRFENVSSTNILDALKGIKDYLTTLSSFSFLALRLPLVDKSVSELVDYVSKFAAKVAALEASPAASLQDLQAKLETAFGLAPGTVSLTMDGSALRISLNFAAAYSGGTIPINLDIASLASGVPGLAGVSQLVDLGGTGSLAVSADATLHLDVGLNLAAPSTPTPFVYDTTNLSLHAKIFGSALNFSAAVGPLGIFVKNGTAVLDKDGAGASTDPAAFTIGLTNDPTDHRYLLTELTTGIVNAGLVGGVDVKLPLYWPSDSVPLGGAPPANELHIVIGSLSNIAGTTTITTPNIAATFSSVDLLTQLTVVIDGLDLLLKTIQDALNAKVFGASLPLVGTKLQEGAQFIQDMRTAVIGKLKALPDQALASVQQAIFNALGPAAGGLNILTLDPNFDDAGADGVPDAAPDFHDVAYVMNSDSLEFMLAVHKARALVDTTANPINFDIGFPGLGLKATGHVVIETGFDFTLGFGVSKTQGFFFDTSAPQELSAGIRMRIPDLSGTGSLGFLSLQVSDEDADSNGANNDPSVTSGPNKYDADGDGRNPSKVEASFAINLKDPNNDGKLTFAELGSAGLSLGSVVAATINGTVDINLDARVSFAGSAVFPSLRTQFDLDWALSGATDAPADSFGGATAPHIAFNDVKLDIGSFFSDFVKPILDEVNTIIEPLRPILKVINQRLPVFSDVGALKDIIVGLGGNSAPVNDISLLDLALAYGSANPQIKAIASAIEIINLIDKISAQSASISGGNILIPLGSFDLGTNDPRASGFNLSAIDPSNVGALAGKVLDQLRALGDAGSAVADVAADFIDQFKGNMGSGIGNPLQFPLLDDPTLAFKLLLGKPVELFVFDMPPLGVNFNVDVFFPIIGPLGVQLKGDFSANLDLLFGYDTRGLAEFASGGFSDPSKILDGFFVSDTAKFDGTGPDIPEAVLKANIEAFAALNVVVASAGVGGGMFAKIEGNLNDPDHDGKLYFDEFVDELPICFIDIAGTLKVGLTAFLKIGVGPLSYTKHFDLATATLVDFTHTCADTPPPLATLDGNILRLNMGPRASVRGVTDPNDPAFGDGDEIFTVTHKSGSAGSETVTVSAFGLSQDYSGFTKIEGEGGAGNDTVELVGVLTDTELWGDFRTGPAASDGADVLRATGSGVGHVTLHGGGGNDELVGGDNADKVFGDGGDDTLQGGPGNDSLDGGSGNDTVDGGDGNDTVLGGSENDVMFGGLGTDSMSGGTGNDNMSGDEDNDTMFGDAGLDSISGGQGADELHGGADADYIQGDTENDTIFGDDGNDTLLGNDGDDELHGGAQNDSMEGNAGADKMYGDGDDDVMAGGTENDSMYGGPGNDSMRGDDGADYMEGEGNNDTMYGGAGNDKMIGGASTPAQADAVGNDSMFGEAGDDIMIGDNGIIDAVTLTGGAGNDYLNGGADNDLIYGQGGNDIEEGGTGNDTMFGNAGNDDMRGQEDNDYMEGGSDNDTMLGGTGNDDMFGDASEVPVGLDGGTAGSDSMVGDAGDDWMLGDNGTINRGAGTIFTNDAGGAGIDVVYGGVGNDIIFGGGLGDLLVGDAADGTGNDLIVGDQGSRTSALYVAQTSPVAGSFGDDSMFGSGGDDTLLGGDGNDSITGDAGNDVIFGDNATITFVGGVIQRLFTTDPTHGGNDTITGSTGADTIFGGKGDDSISGAENPDIIFGDNGVVVLNDGSAQANDLFTTNPNDGGKDTITGGDGDDTVFGGSGGNDLHGLGGDSLSGGGGNDIVIGDNGYVTRNASNVVLRIETTLTNFGGDDRAFGDGGGSDTMLGGFGDDSLVGGEQADIIFGDNGVVVGPDGSGQANDLFSIAPNDGGRDTVDGAAGDDIIIGGTVDDTLGGGSGSDVILGDHAYITRSAANVLEDIKTAFEDNGGSDLVLGGAGNDVLIGGHAGDTMYGDDATGSSGAADGEDIMLGDNGEIVLIGTTGSLLVQGAAVDTITATDTSEANGGADTMSGNAKADVILGGVNSDTIYGDLAAATGTNDGDDILVGDNGTLDFTFTDTDRSSLDLIRSFRDNLGGSDVVSGDRGADVIIGSTAGDTLYGDDANASSGAGDGDDIMLGDNADIFLAGTTGRLLVRGTAVDLITTTDTDESTGGADTMSGNAKNDVVVGGVNADILYGDRAVPNATTIANDGGDILLGDNGLLDFTFESDTDRNTLDLIRSAQDGLGKADLISGNRGGDLAMGGTAGDTIYGDDAAASAGALDSGDILLGDNADVFLVAKGAASGGDLRTVIDSAIKTIRTTDTLSPTTTGGSDTISGNGGGDVIAGGVFGDFLYGDRSAPTAASKAVDGNDIILGDNGALEWLSTGRLNEVQGIDIAANNPALFAKYGTGVADTDLTTLDLITTEQPTSGARDLIYGDEGKDFLFGGTNSDTMYGDDGDETGAATNNDLMFGDHGRLYPQFSTVPGFNARNFFSIDVGDAAGGEGDQMRGEEGADVMLGEQGDDRMWGGTGDDDMIGGTNVAGGADELTAPVINATINPGVNDLMDGGAGNDAMAGDNAIIWRRSDDFQARFEALTAATIYTTTGDTITVNVRVNGALAPQSDPDDAVGRDITLLDHSFTVQNTLPGRFGSDVMAGGADKDVMFGELGDDFMQGDGSIDGPFAAPVAVPNAAPRAITLTDSLPLPTQYYLFNVREQATDSDDYMEGNGGNDLMYGDLGQDDMIGGSSALYGLTTAAMRPDGSDIMFGGAGIDIGRNDIGDASIDANGVITALPTGHARDADFMMGDNANIFRLVKGGATASPSDPNDVFRTFAYDTYAGGLRIIPRGMEELDYTLGGADYAGGSYVNGVANADNGAADLMHGESGDDVIFGMTGSDMLFGEGQDDDIIGGYGNDWMSGGTGQDGGLGDDGLIYTSRNGTAEPLNGIAATTEQTISTPGQIQQAVINVAGELKKTIELVPFSFSRTWNATDDEFPDNDTNTPFADDIIFGGLGSDFLHGGSGDDAISGAEALDHAYVPAYDAAGNPTGVVDLGYAAVSTWLPSNPPRNPGDVLAFNPLDLDGRHLNNRFRAGEFALYDEYEPLREVQLDGSGNLWKPCAVGGPFEFLLNFNKDEGVLRPAGNVAKPVGQQAETYPAVRDDGNDAIFGDLGNDWLVGGTGRDDMYGGWGNDLLNADDDQTTDGLLNDQPDTHPTYEDRAYGGAGRDVMIANTGGDRLIDWVGEYNTYLVPYAPFGEASVSRTLQPQLQEFLYALSRADGADQTQARDTGADPLRNGEPSGELGLVLQKDFAWQDQTGAPADPQAGNIPGGKRDVLRSADFNNGQAQGFFADSGSWTVSGGRYQVAPTVNGGDAVSVFYVDGYVPTYFEMLATINAGKPTGGMNSNAYVVFDYQSATNFKFAGINVSTNKLEIGHRTAQGWIIDTQAVFPGSLRSGTDYNLFLSLNGSTVTLVVDNQVSLSFTFAPRVDAYGISHGLNDGMVGLGARNAAAQIDNVMVQRLAPVTTFSQTVDFTSGTTSLFQAPLSGSWSLAGGRYAGTAGATEPAVDLSAINVTSSALIDLAATLKTTGVGGFVFDQYSATDFKFVTISAGEVTLGHRTAKGWFTDATYSNAAVTPGSIDYTLGVTLKGTTVSVTLNNQIVLSRAYNALVTDGNFGLFGRTGTTSFDSVTVKSDAPNLLNQAFALTADSAPAGAIDQANALTESDVAGVVREAVREWTARVGADTAGALDRVSFVLVNDLPGSALAWTIGDGSVLIDMNAAGWGWFVDPTPSDSREFRAVDGTLRARPNSDAAGHMDLFTVVAHELGHVLGLTHGDDDTDVMAATLRAGERHLEEGETPSIAPTGIAARWSADSGGRHDHAASLVDWDAGFGALGLVRSATPFGDGTDDRAFTSAFVPTFEDRGAGARAASGRGADRGDEESRGKPLAPALAWEWRVETDLSSDGAREADAIL